jgi:hypothetical protein
MSNKVLSLEEFRLYYLENAQDMSKEVEIEVFNKFFEKLFINLTAFSNFLRIGNRKFESR